MKQIDAPLSRMGEGLADHKAGYSPNAGVTLQGSGSMNDKYETIGVAQGVRAGDRAVMLPMHDDDKERLRQEKLARIEKLKAEIRTMKLQAGLCEKCGCDRCPGCDYDHDCFAAERED